MTALAIYDLYYWLLISRSLLSHHIQ